MAKRSTLKTYTVKQLIIELSEVMKTNANAKVFIYDDEQKAEKRMTVLGYQYVMKRNRVRKSFTNKVKRVVLFHDR